ncbi:DUF6600 domain-containing protein [Sandaracinobacteroides hominis]|uniref:DUF6600 domain-containing protein n=1 Tax=Sandaracinobacteroides hominis TaxID=2780086 RepID=UPI0018F45B08|nr:DUF6600 domain-containing protein [Sandaracinobacteroides hominis]
MKRLLVPILAGLSLAGCMTLDDWSEAPGSDRYGYDYPAPVGWWGQNAASIDLFYGPLSQYGRWGSYPGYGQVFWPGNVGSGWSPYSRGYWRTDSRYGRRWVSQEPFGWATYHYGRWGQDPRLGWYWVPDTRFGGSWVDWRSDGMWSPSAPYGYRGRNPWIGKPRPEKPDAGRPRPGDQVATPRPPFRIPPNSHPRTPPEWQGGERPAQVDQSAGNGQRPPRPQWQRGERQPGQQAWQGGNRQPPQGWQGGQRPGLNRQPPPARPPQAQPEQSRPRQEVARPQRQPQASQPSRSTQREVRSQGRSVVNDQ